MLMLISRIMYIVYTHTLTHRHIHAFARWSIIVTHNQIIHIREKGVKLRRSFAYYNIAAVQQKYLLSLFAHPPPPPPPPPSTHCAHRHHIFPKRNCCVCRRECFCDCAIQLDIVGGVVVGPVATGDGNDGGFFFIMPSSSTRCRRRRRK